MLVPVCFMKAEKIKLGDIGITRNKLFIQVITGLLIGIVEVVVIVSLTVLLGFKKQLGPSLYEEGWQYIVYLFYTIFAVALFEEIFFRGYIYKKLSDIIKPKWLLILISSLIFGACHFVGNGDFLQDIPQVLLAAISGMFYCVLREKIRNCTLISLIFMHGIYDFGIAFLTFIIE
ncbi:MAG: CPBP family intramembrane metalloprotease [Lachnospiraceae bacterium]|nr:CPBP family intramembrane metalloprotease [Lachnospiraceae bacterium]